VLELELPDGARVKDALAQIAPLSDGIHVVMAVNHEYADGEVALNAGDELALIPPVSGGAVHARVLAEPLSLDRLIERVRDPAAGAVVTFSGVTREVPVSSTRHTSRWRSAGSRQSRPRRRRDMTSARRRLSTVSGRCPCRSRR
jgi:sulfur carrier protein ThiS